MSQSFNFATAWIDPTSTFVLRYNAWQRGWYLVYLRDTSAEPIAVSFGFVQQQTLSWRLLTN